MRLLSVLALCILYAGCVGGAPPPSFYISPAGNDSWSGLLAAPNAEGTDGPFRTLAAAKVAMEGSAVKIARLRAGTYPLEPHFFFTAKDSGEAWVAYQGETPVIDGGGTGYIALRNADEIAFEGMTFAHFGLNPEPSPYQIVSFNGAHEVFRWNKFVACRNDCLIGIHLTDSIIDSNMIEGQSPGNPPGDIGHYFVAIAIANGSSGDRITHNLVAHAEGAAIAVGSGARDRPCNDDLIDRNLIVDVDSKVVDSGAINIDDRTHSATGNVISNNVIDGVGGAGSQTSWTKAIYLDDLASKVTVTGNLCFNGCGEYALQFHGGDRNVIENNIFDLSKGSLLGQYQDEPWQKGAPGAPPEGGYASLWMVGNIFTRNIVYAAGEFPDPLWRMSLHDPRTVPLSDSGNLYYSGGAAPPDIGADPLYADPEFADPETGDFAIAALSPAYTKLGFQPLVTDQGPLPRPTQLP